MTRTLARLHFLALALVPGCSFLEPREDPTRYFVLTAMSPGAPSAADPALAIAVGPITLPDYLLRAEIVRRTGPNEVEPSRVDRWAEPIDRALVRVLCRDLQTLLPASAVAAFPVAPAEKPALQVEIDVSRFEADPTRGARLEGRWRLRDPRLDRRAAREFRLEQAIGDGGTEAVAASMSELVAKLAKEIVEHLGDGGAR